MAYEAWAAAMLPCRTAVPALTNTPLKQPSAYKDFSAWASNLESHQRQGIRSLHLIWDRMIMLNFTMTVRTGMWWAK
ncbi:hypothetical protein HAX54_047173 [Datura stramonium]|uniref:Uncharacterized protein n=1 Tax=Datura stramonium TaxID=4076 RepID=A0ABS8SS19_DATST|nr:hypothetical protein [Datura stramonium]